MKKSFLKATMIAFITTMPMQLVANSNSIKEVTDTVNMLIEHSMPKYEEVAKPTKPSLPPAKNLTKGEFETTKEFEARRCQECMAILQVA